MSHDFNDVLCLWENIVIVWWLDNGRFQVIDIAALYHQWSRQIRYTNMHTRKRINSAIINIIQSCNLLWNIDYDIKHKSYLMFKLSYIVAVVLLQLCSQISLSLLFVICLPRIRTSFILLIIIAKPLPSVWNNQQEINKQKCFEYILKYIYIHSLYIAIVT